MIGDAVGHAGDHGEVVGDEDQPHAVLVDQPLQQIEDARLRGDVERGGRLVGDQQLGLERDRHGDHDALALAAGQLVRIAVEREARAPAGRRGRAPRAPSSSASRAAGAGDARARSRPPASPMVFSGLSARHRLLEHHADRPGRGWPHISRSV